MLSVSLYATARPNSVYCPCALICEDDLETLGLHEVDAKLSVGQDNYARCRSPRQSCSPVFIQHVR